MFIREILVITIFCGCSQSANDSLRLPSSLRIGLSTILDEAGFDESPLSFLPPGRIEEIFGQQGFAQVPPVELPPPSRFPSMLPSSLPQFLPIPQILTPPLSTMLPSVPQAAVLPPGFVCVPIGTCNPANNNGIDIRIVTPGNTSLCPAGQVPCAGSAGGNQCGLRFVSPVNTADGFATPGAYPWQVYLLNQTGYAGSGVLLDQFTILTAAHKVYMNSGTPDMIGVYLGVYDSSQLGIRYNVSRVLLHPNFNPSNLFNDLALLRLTTPVTPVTQQTINTACLPTQGQSFVGQNCSVSGWGTTGFNMNDAPTRQQKQVQVPIVSYTTCFTSMSNASVLGPNVNTYLDAVGELCAGGQAAQDACTHDGGSPLVCNVNGRFTVAGLVLWGKGCGQAGVYGVYANVAYYVTWITSAMAMLNR